MPLSRIADPSVVRCAALRFRREKTGKGDGQEGCRLGGVDLSVAGVPGEYMHAGWLPGVSVSGLFGTLSPVFVTQHTPKQAYCASFFYLPT